MVNVITGVNSMLNETETLPEGLHEARVEDLHDLLGGPTLIHLPGRQPEPLFVSVLLHGNEDAGFLAVQALLCAYASKELPRALSLFIGNVSAARAGQRRLNGQPDYNRVWPGTTTPELPEARMMRRLVECLRARRAFASIDVHNNTGINPHYACINRIDNRFLHLAALFSRTVVYFIRPLGVQAMAMSEVCPALTIECGKPGQEYGVEHARDFLEACLHLHEIPSHPLPSHDVDLYHTVATVKIPEQVSFGFERDNVDLRLVEGIDHLNFRELPANTVLGRVRDGATPRLDVSDEHGRDVYDRYFRIERETLLTNCPFMPSMLTLDEKIIRQDCLGYLMERLLPEAGH
jgi:succinylglutamate desuccinylase